MAWIASIGGAPVRIAERNEQQGTVGQRKFAVWRGAPLLGRYARMDLATLETGETDPPDLDNYR
jgi:hypothetical protein